MRKRIRNGKTTKTDLALAIHEVLDLPMDKVRREPVIGLKIVDIIRNAMVAALRRGESVYIRGLGKFTVRKPREFWYVKRPAIHNTTGKIGHTNIVYSDVPQRYPAKAQAYFTPSIQLMAMLNQDTPNYSERVQGIETW